MVIETLAQLAFESGAERISIEIAPADKGTTSAMIVTSFGQQGLDKNDEGRLLAVLAKPLVVNGNVGEMDGKVIGLVDELRSYVIEASDKLPETDAKKRRDELKGAGKTEDTTDNSEGSSETQSDVDEIASGQAESL